MSQRGLRAQSWQRSSYLQPGSKVHKRHRRRCAPIRRYGALASCSRSRATLSGLVRALAGSSRLSLCERFGSAFPLHAVQLSREVPADPVSFLPAPPAKRLVPRYVGLSGNTGGHTSKNLLQPTRRGWTHCSAPRSFRGQPRSVPPTSAPIFFSLYGSLVMQPSCSCLDAVVSVPPVF